MEEGNGVDLVVKEDDDIDLGIKDEGKVVQGKVDWRGRPAKKGKHGGIYNSLFALALFGFDTLSTTALVVNFVTYFTGIMHFNIANASNVLTNVMGTSYILSVVVAYFADAFIGRYKAALISAIIEIMGIVLLTVQAHLPKLKPPPCNVFDPTSQCEKVHGRQAVLLYTGLYLLATGMAGIKATVPSHGADQFDEKDAHEAKQMSSFFNWILLSASTGAALSLMFIVRIQTNVGWDWGFGSSTIAIVIGTLVFAAGIPRYRVHVIQETNPIIDVFKVFVVSFQNRKLQLPMSSEELYEIDTTREFTKEVEFLPHRDIFKFLDKAAIRESSSHPSSDKPAEARSSWKLCRVTQVEQAKIIVGMIPIFCSTIIMSTCLAQLQTFSIQQGVTMDARITHSFHIPPATLPVIPFLFIMLAAPTYDRVFVPLAHRLTGVPTGITHLQRIGVGLLISCVSMATAALVEVKRKNVAHNHGDLDAIPVLQPLPISIFWLSFQYFIFGVAEVFSYVGLLQFFYSEAPKALKSTATCFMWCSMSLGYFLSTVLVDCVNRATRNITKSGGWLAGNNLNRNHLNLFYWLLAILSFINFVNYLFWARWYKYRPQSTPKIVDENVA